MYYQAKDRKAVVRLLPEYTSECSPWRRQHQEDLSEYIKSGITKHELDLALRVPHAMRIITKNNKMYISEETSTWLTKSIVERMIKFNQSHHLFWMFLPQYCSGSLPDMEMVLTAADWERPKVGRKKVPIFCWSKKVGQSGILYPYWQHLTSETMLKMYRELQIPIWSEKLDVAFFRGSTTGMIMHTLYYYYFSHTEVHYWTLTLFLTDRRDIQ